MNPWYVLGIEICVFLTLIICFIVILVKLISKIAKKNYKPIKKLSVFLSLDVLLLALSLVFVLSHSSYYKFNDWEIVGSNISDIQSKYGDFDVGTIRKGYQGEVGYYIYTDDGPIMPDHLPHYYYIHYDENELVDGVHESCAIGG